MKIEKVQRDSGLELLRIIAMFFIIAHHYTNHGGFEKITLDTISCSTIYISCLEMFGKVGCMIFAIITGYSMISKQVTLKEQLKKSIQLAGTMLFYSLLCLIVSYIFIPQYVGIKDIIYAFIPFFKGNWYVKCYLYFCLFIPYINQFISSLSKASYRKLLVLIAFTWIILSTLTGYDTYDVGEFGFMLIAYLFGAYSKLYLKDKKCNNNRYLLISLICFILLILSVVLIDNLSVLLESESLLKKSDYFIEWNSILSFGLAYFIFMFFSNKHFVNKIVNLVASTTIGIYLFHDNELVMVVIWKIIFPNINYVNNPYIHSIIKIIAVFLIGMIIDLIRQNIFKKMSTNIINKNYEKLYEKLKKQCMFIETKLKNIIS